MTNMYMLYMYVYRCTAHTLLEAHFLHTMTTSMKVVWKEQPQVANRYFKSSFWALSVPDASIRASLYHTKQKPGYEASHGRKWRPYQIFSALYAGKRVDFFCTNGRRKQSCHYVGPPIPVLVAAREGLHCLSECSLVSGRGQIHKRT